MICAFALAELVQPMTVEEVRKSIYDCLAIVGVTTTNWKPGAVVRTIISAVAVLVSSLTVMISLIAGSGFLALARGVWLTLVARYVYGVERIQASFAVGEVRLTNAAGGSFSWDPEDLVFETPDGRQYRNLEAVTLGASATVLVAVQALVIGSIGTAYPGEIDRLAAPINNLSVTNSAAIVGEDEETDENLRIRCSDKLGSLSPNGPPDAYAYIARSARRPDGTAINVTRIKHTRDGFGNIDVYLATASGEVVDADVSAIDDDLQRRATPLGVTLRTHSATAKPVGVVYRARCYNTLGLTQSEIAAAVRQELIEWAKTEPIGGNPTSADSSKIECDAIESVIRRARYNGQSIGIFHVDLLSPTVDIPIFAPEVMTLGSIVAASIVQLPPSSL